MQHCISKKCHRKVIVKRGLCWKHYNDPKYNDKTIDYRKLPKANRKAIIKDNIAYIPLGNNKGFAIVDKHNAWVDKYPWCLGKHKYAHSKINGKSVLLHVLLFGKHGKLCNDHINRNRLDNRSSNMRIVSRAINNRNRHLSNRNKSGYMGVSWHQQTKKWNVTITANYKRYNLGLYTDLEDAVLARKEAEKLYWE